MVEPCKGSSFNKSTGLTYNYYYFLTKSLVEYNDLNSLFYSNLNPDLKRVKINPTNVFDLLSSIGLAFWLMDVGNITGKGIHLIIIFLLRA